MTTNDLYQAALADFNNRANNFFGSLGVARVTLPNGGELICSVQKVAGRSIVARHLRTEYGYRPAGEQYAKQISRAKAVDLLK